MSSYDYTDSNCDTLRVISGPGNNVRLLMLNNTTCWVTADDAPAVALAILEAAGIEGWNYRDDRLASAVVALTEHKRQQDAKAEREAEDAKVREFIRITRDFTIAEPNEKDREMYRAARRFFEEA